MEDHNREGVAPNANEAVKLLTSFVPFWNTLGRIAYENAEAKGFWEDGKKRNDYETLMLVVTELAEVAEGLRHGNPESDKIPGFTQVEEEVADVLIRLADWTRAKGHSRNLARAIIAKLEYNAGRPYKHGKSA